ncbi:hypothetical protein ARMSODRAFT_981323 [Armillaria solidipes]|uniref:Uncharacterized protein n=1 Tax=Armillaria solidipes TaxID=1076256 RepID=A0A2H3ASM0_9AGAR|nr:hypothetical protein ARMSODRAFT_981323 [Armillaria solidipes]
MQLDDFAAGVNRLHPLLNPDKHGQFRPTALTKYLKKSTPFLIQVLKFAREDKVHPAALFARNLLYTCETIATKLPTILHDSSFDEWELWRSKRSGCIKIEEDAPLPAIFLSNLSQPKGCKCPASPFEDSGDWDASSDDDDEVLGDAASGDDGSDDESEEESDESEEERTDGKDVPKPKAPSPGKAASTSGTTSQAKGAAKNQKKNALLPKKKFTAPKEPEVGLSITIPVGPPKKAPKTQPGSVKDEPIPAASSSRGSRASQRPKGKGEEKPVASSSKAAALAMVTIKNKKHLVFGTHRYGREVLIPVKDEEIDHITQASTVDEASAVTTVRLPPRASALFVPSPFSATMLVRSWLSLSRRPLTFFVTKDVHTSISCTSAALQVFETCANAAAQAAQQYRASLEETLTICQDAATNEGSNALRGIVFESRDFEDQLHVALIKVDRYSSTPLNTIETSSFDQIIAQALGKPPLRTDSPSLPVVEGSGVIATPA